MQNHKNENLTLYIILPAYNEEDTIAHTIEVVNKQAINMSNNGLISKDSKICIVDDKSTDNTWNIIEDLIKEYSNLCAIKLSRNNGHQNALFAGMMTFCDKCDCIITMDADLQDDPNVLLEFVKKYNEGYDIVYGVRASRKHDKQFKRHSANLYYKLMKKWGVDVVDNHADYRLLSKRALLALSKYGETNLFLRGIIPMLGFNSCEIRYDRQERYAGDSKYSLKKMISLALQGVLAFSIKPITIITLLGVLAVLLGIVVAIWTIYTIVTGKAILGWSSTIISIWILGGAQLIAIGIVGQYIGKIYLETKRRPRFIVQDSINCDFEKNE